MTSGALRGVRVYRNGRFGDPEDVLIEGSAIVADAAGALGVASGGYLVPGLIDCHVHVTSAAALEGLSRFGVTTALDMGTPLPLLTTLRTAGPATDLRAAGGISTSPASRHAVRMHAPPENLVASPAEADLWVAARVNEGADYIKIVIDLPGFDQDTVDALVAAAHARGKRVVAHASRSDAVAMAQRAGVDVLTHAPLDRSVGTEQAEQLVSDGTLIIPTLVMMHGMANATPTLSYAPARASVAALHAAGMPILAGTDANEAPGAPSTPAFGESLHEELALLVEAGLSPAEALDSATSIAADSFGLTDRGRIAPGLRADLVLLGSDPLADIRASRDIRGVWLAGQQI